MDVTNLVVPLGSLVWACLLAFADSDDLVTAKKHGMTYLKLDSAHSLVRKIGGGMVSFGDDTNVVPPLQTFCGREPSPYLSISGQSASL